MSTAYVITLVGGPPPSDTQSSIAALVRSYGGALESEDVLTPDFATDYYVTLPPGAALPLCKTLRIVAADRDVAVQPAATRSKKLLLADMDSTIVTGETIDELATRAGVGEKVAAITARAMNGELDFQAALRKRVALLEGLPVSVLDEVAASLNLSAGAEELIRTLAVAGVRTVLVSGGFDHVTGLIRQHLGFERDVANHLETAGGKLTGHTRPPIVDAARKAEILMEECTRLGIAPTEAMTVGDGANDLLMTRKAGLGVAYYGKPALKAEADAWIEHGDLTTLLYFAGLTPDI